MAFDFDAMNTANNTLADLKLGGIAPFDLIVDQRGLLPLPEGTVFAMLSALQRTGAQHVVLVGLPNVTRALRLVMARVPTGLNMPLTASSFENAEAVLRIARGTSDV